MAAEFQELLKRTMGLDAASIGMAAVERAVQQRMGVCGLRDEDAYLEKARTSAEELQELIETVVVPETWFFRDREAFAALARVVSEEWLRTHPEGVLRVLSLPCSTGEEPYSAAMALLDAGFPAERFRIDAFDISGRSLRHAARAVYGRNSFRGGGLDFRERHFTPADAGWRLGEAVCRQVRFHQGNILDAGLPAGAGPYDVVFCRNLLIYFDRATQDGAIATLARLLAPKGWLFVGPSETGLLLSHAFVPAKVPLAFAFRHPAAIPREVPVRAATPPLRAPPPPRAAAVGRAFPFSSVAVRPAAPAAVAPSNEALDRAARLADQGHFVEAAAACEAHLRARGPSAEAFYVLGLVRDATGNHAAAVELYRKALYLEPRHHEAMVHLAFLLDGLGDRAGAKVLNERARRLEAKTHK